MVFLASTHSALDPAGPQSAHIDSLWWLFFFTTGAVYLIVVAALLLAVLRRRAQPSNEHRIRVVVGSAVGVTTIILFVFLVCEFRTGERLFALSDAPDQLEIKIVGHQWWWEVEYQDPIPSHILTTANEIHIPVGVPVKLDLESNDVIHSFWAPSLSGKRDLIPGHPTHLWLQADHAGTYQGQCAEFCGMQHAHMRFLVVAEERAAFDEWLQSHRKPAPEPVTEVQKRGQAVFLDHTCVICHSIEGTTAMGRVGPNLTHIGSSTTIGAGTLPNTPGNRARWIQNPHDFKPGIVMPQHDLAAGDLEALNEYLGSLK